MKNVYKIFMCVVAFSLMAICHQVKAQTFYELIYTDNLGFKNVALMFDSEDGECNLRLIKQIDNSLLEGGTLFSYDYIINSPEEEGIAGENYTVMACSDKDAPSLIWLWDAEEPDYQQMVPYISLKAKDKPKNWIRADYFTEMKLTELNDSYLQQFYSTDEDFYNQIRNARAEAKRSEMEIIKTLGNGFDIFDVMYTELQKTKGKAKDPNLMNDVRNEIERQTGIVEVRDIPTSVDMSQKPVLHMFLLANTEVADIGSACKIDCNNISNEMKGIAQSLDIKIKEYNVTGANYSKDYLKQELNRLNPGSNDIVLFLYTGHGFRFEDQEDEFPMLALTTNDYQELDGNYVALSDVYQAICSKGARLNIVLSDCCNSEISERRPLTTNTLFSRGNNNFSLSKLNDLFLNRSGSILSTAASPGEYSWCDSAGGMFTLSFIQSLRKEISAFNKSEVNWQDVIDNTLSTALQRSEATAKAQNGLKKMQINN